MYRKLSNSFGNEFLTILTTSENKWIHMMWNGYLSDAAVKEGALAVLDVIKESGLSCVLNDMQQVQGPIRSTEWAVVEWAPQVAKAGLKRMALVNSPDAIAAPDISNFHSQQTHFTTEVFDNIEAAKEWLSNYCV